MIATVHVSEPNQSRSPQRDGRYLFAGDAGNVINTQTRKSVGTIVPLVDSRYNIEIDWAATACARHTHGNRWATCHGCAPQYAAPFSNAAQPH